VQDRGLAAYIAELIGTLFLVFTISTVFILYLSTSPEAQTGSDFAVIGLAHAFVLFLLVITLGAASGGHFNPAITLAAVAMRRIDPIDAIVYILAQLSGGVLGALMAKGFLLDEGRASNYGAAEISPMLANSTAGALLEAIGTFLLVMAVLAVAMNPLARREWAPFVIGITLGFVVMVIGPLTGAAVNPARWFGPALIGNAFGGFGDIWPYIIGPIVGALVAVGVFRFVIAGPQYVEGPNPPIEAPEKLGRT
jgi:glycerol uptake facilitator protein